MIEVSCHAALNHCGSTNVIKIVFDSKYLKLQKER